MRFLFLLLLLVLPSVAADRTYSAYRIPGKCPTTGIVKQRADPLPSRGYGEFAINDDNDVIKNEFYCYVVEYYVNGTGEGPLLATMLEVRVGVNPPPLVCPPPKLNPVTVK